MSVLTKKKTDVLDVLSVTKQQADDFEFEMVIHNFVIGRYTNVFTGNQIICPNETEMLKHAYEYNQKTNRTYKLSFMTVRLSTVTAVLFKEVNATKKQVTYKFQKDANTVVVMTVNII